ncbi:MAG: outer membrane protein [Pseudolabrys sp.]
MTAKTDSASTIASCELTQSAEGETMRRLVFALLASTLFIGAAAAADLPVKAPVYKAPVMAPVYNWTGFYIGANIGYSWGRQDVDAVGGVPLGNPNIDGVIGGGQIGYNWQMNQLVLGIEADIQASGQKGDGTFVPGPAALALPTITFTDKLDWFGTVRGRVGYAMDRWLPYVTGGWAYGGGSISGSTSTPTTFSGSTTYSGWTIGGGLEYAFMNNWSVKAEYLYIDFGNGPTVNGAIVGGRMTDNIARLGVNYRF